MIETESNPFFREVEADGLVDRRRKQHRRDSRIGIEVQLESVQHLGSGRKLPIDHDV